MGAHKNNIRKWDEYDPIESIRYRDAVNKLTNGALKQKQPPFVLLTNNPQVDAALVLLEEGKNKIKIEY